MVILDTDHVTLMQREESTARVILRRRLKAINPPEIAATVLVRNATRLTRNLVDFRKVPGLKAEDWTTE